MKEGETLEDFILRWNVRFGSLVFAAKETPVTKRPTNIEVRFAPNLYQDFLTDENWFELVRKIADKSHNLLYVTTDETLFRVGILEMVVSSQSKEYKDVYIIEALEWIGREFFPYVSIA